MHPNKINNEIRSKSVRLIGLKGEQIGIIKLQDALIQAKSIGFDLVEISPNSVPPVCRIMNYGKFLYAKNKTLKEQKKKQKIIHLKEVKFRPSTDIGDYQVKIRSLIRFLKQGDKLKVTLRFRGREMMHINIGLNMLHRIKNDLQNLAIVESFPSKIEGRQMIMILIPKKKN
ncbi:translation initiation factor IF-3 [Enterobacteriaceae endosymbiont of Neohaemonia nigricornis]|uniref:translation initiation factor IF-3 n=1 Tax=Enterobacteriaceae endosymbiont of Neohaemonia nigricornis TaxID=2675792 RepID=UPI001448B804|nr:translation initiation factor IF-3 [Enterobacteriaceae endosymbiont of Neohaemonia nigricornis]QJC30306.1 translation initiation factor IF-3 [Enterobacteriaceae endosymbiont of Neohaemonia nigricornis]